MPKVEATTAVIHKEFKMFDSQTVLLKKKTIQIVNKINDKF